MPLITDPDDLNQGVEVVFNGPAQTVQLLVAGNLDNDGVTGKALYSFVKEEWRGDAALFELDYPMEPITDEFFELINGWDFADATSRNLIRRSGWLVRNTAGNVVSHRAGAAILSAENDDQIYYDIGAGATNFVFTGNTAEAIEVISDPNGDGNYADGFDRTADLRVFNRQQGQLFSAASSLLNGESSGLTSPKLFSLGLPTGTDLNIAASDATISTTAPYTGMSITYHATPQQRDIGGANRDFGVIIDGNNGSLEQIYEFIQYQLRQAGDIDAGAGTVLGQTADELLGFIGGAGDGSGTLRTRSVTNAAGGGSGVYIDNFQAADTNRLELIDNTATIRTFPFVAAVTLQFSQTLVDDPDAVYRVFFTDANGNQFGTANAILVDDNSGSDVLGNISGSATLQFDFDYDANTQGGRTAGTDADITVVAQGLAGAQYVKATGTITRSVTNTVSLVAPTERVYANAA